MTKFTKFTALAVAALVMASTSAMATPIDTRTYTQGTFSIPNTALGLATAGNALGNKGSAAGAAGAGIAYIPNFNTKDEFGSSTNYIQGYRAGVQSSAASMRAGTSSGGIGGLSGLGGLGGGFGAITGTGGLSGALGSLSGGLGQLGYTLNTIGGIAGVDLGGRTLMQAGSIAGVAGGLTNGQNYTNLANNLTTSANQFGTGITQSVNQIGSAFGRRAPVTGATTTITHEAAHGATTPTPAPTQGFVGPPS